MRYMCLMGPISAGFSALKSCETGILHIYSVTVLSVYVCFTLSFTFK